MGKFEAGAQLTDEELWRANEFDRDSAFETLRHIVDVDWSWRQFCLENDVGTDYLWDKVPMTNFEQVRAVWEKDAKELMEYVNGLDEVELGKEIALPYNKDVRVKVWQILA